MKSNTSSGSGVRSSYRTEYSNISKQGSTRKSANSEQEHKPEKSLKKRIITVLIYVLVAVIGLGTGGGIYVYQLISKVGYTAVGVVDKADYTPVDIGSLDSQDVESGNTTSSWSQGGHTKVFVDSKFPIKKVAQKDPNVENILVFGVDSRGTDDVDCRADAIMIVSLDNNTKTIKIISLMRDCAVTIEGRTSADKLTHSYAYGGVGLLINTINNNFGLDVQRFVMLDFSSSANLIDLVGGVDVDVKTNEVKYANGEINYQNGLMGTNEPLLTSSGLQTLSGVQAIAWARIRHLDSDFVRSSRQRVVATAMMTKVASQNKLAQLSLLKNCAGIFETNMTQADLLRLGTVGVSLIKNIVQYRIPDDGLYTVQDNPWMEIINWEKQIPKLHEYIWGTSDI
jgi:LCP family protein required for cell wall assembly